MSFSQRATTMTRSIASTIATILFLFCLPAQAQQPVAIAPVPYQQFFSQSGVPLAGGFVYTYAAGTTTPLVTYSEATGTYPNTNPIVLNSGGYATIWLTIASYKFCVTDSSNVQQWCVDNINQFGILSGTTFLSPMSFNGLVTFNAGAALNGTFSGNPIFSGNPSFSGNLDAGSINNILYVDGTKFANIQAAINALPSIGGTVIVPAGTFAQGVTPLTVGTSNVTLQCDNSGATTITTTDTSSGAAFSFTGQNPRVIGCNFQGPSSGAADGLVFTNGASSVPAPTYLLNVTVSHMGGMGVRIDTSSAGNESFSTLQNVTTSFNGSDGVKLVGTNSNDCIIVGGASYDNTGWGYNIQSGGNSFVGANANLNGASSNQDFQFTGTGNFGSIYPEGSANGNLTFGSSSQGNLLFLNSLAGSGIVADTGTNNMVFYNYGGQIALNKLSIGNTLSKNFVQTGNAPQASVVGNATNDAQYLFTSNATSVTTPNKTIGTCTSGNDFCIFNNALTSIFDETDKGTLQAQRFKPNQNSTAYVGADTSLVLSGGWGSTATISGAYGSDQAVTFLVNSAGTGQASVPTITQTFKDGTWTNQPICLAQNTTSSASTTVFTPMALFSSTPTQYVWTYAGTPSNGQTYGITIVCMGGR